MDMTMGYIFPLFGGVGVKVVMGSSWFWLSV